MSKKYIPLLIIIAILLSALTAFAETEKNHSSEKTELIIYCESGYYSVSEISKDIETHHYYEGYNQSTVNWLKSQTGVCVPSPEGFVIMNKKEADELEIQSMTDVMIEDTISCNVIENRSIGSGLKNIIVVENIDLISKNETASWA